MIMGHLFAKAILIFQMIELIAEKYNLTIEEAKKRLYNSDIITLLDDDETGLYGESALYLMSLYEERELKNKQ